MPQYIKNLLKTVATNEQGMGRIGIGKGNSKQEEEVET